MSALLNLESVGKRFGFRNILNNINFSVDTGEFVMEITVQANQHCSVLSVH